MKKNQYAKLYILRSDGRYQGYWRDLSGKRHVAYDRDPEQLHNKLEKIKQDIGTTPPLLFADIAKAWRSEAESRLAAGTLNCYSAAYERAMEAFGCVEANQVSIPDITELLRDMACKRFSARTIKAQRQVISSIYKFAANNREYSDIIKNNPAAMAELPRALKPAAKRSAPDESTTDLIRQNWRLHSFGLFVFLLLCTGLRRGEALGLQWKDIDYERNTITVRGAVNYLNASTATYTVPKTANSYRTIPLLPVLKEALREQNRGHSDEFVFHGEIATKPLAEATYRRRWKVCCDAIGINITAHQLRHGYATMLYEAGVDVLTAQKLLGHADPQTTIRVYTDLRNRYEKLSVYTAATALQKVISGGTEKS